MRWRSGVLRGKERLLRPCLPIEADIILLLQKLFVILIEFKNAHDIEELLKDGETSKPKICCAFADEVEEDIKGDTLNSVSNLPSVYVRVQLVLTAQQVIAELMRGLSRTGIGHEGIIERTVHRYDQYSPILKESQQ